MVPYQQKGSHNERRGRARVSHREHTRRKEGPLNDRQEEGGTHHCNNHGTHHDNRKMPQTRRCTQALGTCQWVHRKRKTQTAEGIRRETARTGQSTDPRGVFVCACSTYIIRRTPSGVGVRTSTQRRRRKRTALTSSPLGYACMHLVPLLSLLPSHPQSSRKPDVNPVLACPLGIFVPVTEILLSRPRPTAMSMCRGATS